jgi:hypothetical protein
VEGENRLKPLIPPLQEEDLPEREKELLEDDRSRRGNVPLV